jgi:hypothetical protein
MPVREFIDSKGASWRVWKTRPTISALYAEELRNGWLTFESATARRRLAPVPGDWEDISRERLELLCRAALEVSSRLSRDDGWSDSPDETRPDQ